VPRAGELHRQPGLAHGTREVEDGIQRSARIALRVTGNHEIKETHLEQYVNDSGITGNGMARTGIAWRTQSPALCSKVVFAMPGGSP
jgi:hypothetical protein